ncbi:lactose permease [Kluyveromyces marxianus DMKU3-1042]|uniref:Lactose permease n=1 Tax=Kluyveromyces marxianus (strain DMKU3-1042 / BCC 29191 / NBRC 104275) TaxID=1003335 RepID=W0TAG2_KLUMD|nr:lactose permease [Kluyveromyces marxianus DMKU3-1042]BAO40023.1 lactose permease [Kluyveromyces marxianus DMKU3-1042]
MTEKWSESSSLHKNTPLGAVEHKETSDSENKYHFYAEDTNETNIMDETDLPGYLSKQYLPLYGMCFIVYLCSTMQGYDGSLMGSIYTQKAYLNYYHLDVNSSTGTGLVFSIYNIGQICGAFFAPIMDWKGRKPAILIGCFGVVAASVVTAATSTKSALIGGRWMLSFFATIACSAAPAYCVEVSPMHLRGKVAGLYNTLWYVGSIVAAFTTYGTNKNFPNSSKAFKIPLYCQMIFPGLVCIFGWLLPESPRWLVGVGREEEAREFIAKYHFNGNREHPLIDFEMSEIIESFHGINMSAPLEVLDLRPLFRKRSDRYRLGLVIAMAWFGQFSGNNVCSYYLPTMLTSVGMKSVSVNVLMNGVYSIVSWVASIIGSFCHDKVGRRKMFMISTLGAALALSGLAICTARYQAGSKGASKGTLVFIYLFGVIFSFAFTPMQPIYPSEVSTNLMRSKAQLVNNVVAGVAQFVNQFAAPKAMKNIKYWFYVFYVFFDIFEFIIVYFFFVETKGKTLEELAAVFEAPNPRKASTDPVFAAQVREQMAKESEMRGIEAEKVRSTHFEEVDSLSV